MSHYEFSCILVLEGAGVGEGGENFVSLFPLFSCVSILHKVNNKLQCVYNYQEDGICYCAQTNVLMLPLFMERR